MGPDIKHFLKDYLCFNYMTKGTAVPRKIRQMTLLQSDIFDIFFIITG